VEVRLPCTSVVLNIVSEGGALNIWVVCFSVDEIGVEFLKSFQFIDSCGERGGVVLLEEVLGDVSDG
jgi:hypothetical protein